MNRTLAAALLALPWAMPAAVRAQAPAPPNSQMKAVLDVQATFKGRPIATLTPADARKQPTAGDAVRVLLKDEGKGTDPEPVARVQDLAIPGPGGKIPIRVYTPRGANAAGPLPVLVYWHGGGFVVADINTYDATPRALANAAGCLVVSCEYRHAPEYRFPAAPDDALAAYRWVLANAPLIGGDPSKVAVGGESAGGNLATVTALRARDLGLPRPVHQLLVYPVVDARLDTPSYAEYADARPLDAAMMRRFWGSYLARPEDATNPYASPLLAPLDGRLPPATVIAAEIDPLRSEGKAYADRLASAGVPTTYALYPGVTHEFFGMGAAVDEARKAVAGAADALKASFAK